MDAVVIRTFAIRENAEMAMGLLEDAGIAAVLESDDAGGAFPTIYLSGGGFRVLVNELDRDQAEEVLAVLLPEHTR